MGTLAFFFICIEWRTTTAQSAGRTNLEVELAALELLQTLRDNPALFAQVLCRVEATHCPVYHPLQPRCTLSATNREIRAAQWPACISCYLDVTISGANSDHRSCKDLAAKLMKRNCYSNKIKTSSAALKGHITDKRRHRHRSLTAFEQREALVQLFVQCWGFRSLHLYKYIASLVCSVPILGCCATVTLRDVGLKGFFFVGPGVFLHIQRYASFTSFNVTRKS